MFEEQAQRRQEKAHQRRNGQRVSDDDLEADQRAIDEKFGTDDLELPKILKAEEIISFDKYFDFQEGLNYVLLLHIMRMILLVKTVNKSQNLKY